GTVRFEVPVAKTPPGQLTFHASADRTPFRDREELEVWAYPEWRWTLALDRLWHRPGETVYWRALAVEPRVRSMPALPVHLEIEDTKGQVVFSEHTQTSELGVAHGEWMVPDSMASGDYSLRVVIDDGDLDAEQEQEIRIAPYELPTTNIRVEVQEPFILPGKEAPVEITIANFAGSPIAGALVEIGERFYWWRDDPEELEDLCWSGVTDQAGRVVALIDVTDTHKWLADSEYQSWSDEDFRVSATDPATLRMTTVPFSIRVTEKPVHIYTSSDDSQPSGHPRHLWVTTFTAGGEPISCEIEALWIDDDGRLVDRVATGSTDEWGVVGLEIPDRILAECTNYEGHLSIEAWCDDGSVIKTTLDWWEIDADDWNAIRVEPLHPILGVGEPLVATILASPGTDSVRVEVSVNGRRLSMTDVAIIAGRGRVSIPFTAEMKGRVVISATGWAEKGGALAGGAAAVLYPDPGRATLRIAAEPEKGAPGAPISLRLNLDQQLSDPAAAVVGVVAVDRASEEAMAVREHRFARSGFGMASTDSFGDESGSHGIWNEDSLLDAGERALEPDLENVARLVLGSEPTNPLEAGRRWGRTSHQLYRCAVKKAASVFEGVLGHCSTKSGEGCWGSIEGFHRSLAGVGLAFGEELDPWDQPLVAGLDYRGSSAYLELSSVGPDGLVDTKDDIEAASKRWPWFGAIGRNLQPALEAWAERQRRQPKDEFDVRQALTEAGISPDDWRDPWDRPMTLEVEKSGCDLEVTAWSFGRSGEPGKWGAREGLPDVQAWRIVYDTFQERSDRIEDILREKARRGESFPVTENEVAGLLAEAGLGKETMRDLHGREMAVFPGSRIVFTDDVVVDSEGIIEAEPVRRIEPWIVIRSSGRDGQWGNPDDREVARFDGQVLLLDQISPIRKTLLGRLLGLDDRSGAIVGRVIDLDGMSLPGVTVSASRDGLPLPATITDIQGRFTLHLPVGTWRVSASLVGFETVTVETPISARRITTVSFKMPLGAITDSILVTAEAPIVETTSVMTGAAVEESAETPGSLDEPGADRPGEAVAGSLVTPRVRTDFRETAVWAPEVGLDPEGQGVVRFTLPDAVTTWRIQAVASTLDGRVSDAEILLPAPLALETRLDLPSVLTEGDRLELPVAVRHDLDGSRTVALSVEGEGALLIWGDPIEVKADPAFWERRTFSLGAKAAGEGVVRATAMTEDASDAVELRTTVQPLAKKDRISSTVIVRTEAELSNPAPEGAAVETLRLDIDATPAARIERALRAQALRPGGCAEQIASNGLAWQILADELDYGRNDDAERAAEARRQGRLTLARLEDRVSRDGSVSYWRGGRPSVALAARVLELTMTFEDHPNAVTMGDRIIEWLIKAQRSDGGWARNDLDSNFPLTATVARVLVNGREAPGATEAAGKAVRLLEGRLEAFAEPFAVAQLALAAARLGRHELSQTMVGVLEETVRWDGDLAYWHAGINLPLGGWGLPGRLEATAAAVLALAELEGNPELVNSGARFLLARADGTGAWYSTSATLAAIEAVMAAGILDGKSGGVLEIRAGGLILGTLDLDLNRSATSIELDPSLETVEVVRTGGDQPLLARLDAQSWVPWPEDGSAVLGPDSENLALSSSCNSTRVVVGDEVLCTVKVRRTRFRGFGMLLVEFGLPPGSEVDEDALMTEAGGRYEIRPDR
ncbi:MAG: hypothetical protein DRJ65_23035, partial [Acidobacteria bacterium]